jgi:molecular chaperone DnaK (HSP70)
MQNTDVVSRDLTKMFAEVTDGVNFKSRFELLSEPEAAVLQATHDTPNYIVIGIRVMVVDIGGGTTDTTLHEIGKNFTKDRSLFLFRCKDR